MARSRAFRNLAYTHFNYYKCVSAAICAVATHAANSFHNTYTISQKMLICSRWFTMLLFCCSPGESRARSNLFFRLAKIAIFCTNWPQFKELLYLTPHTHITASAHTADVEHWAYTKKPCTRVAWLPHDSVEHNSTVLRTVMLQVQVKCCFIFIQRRSQPSMVFRIIVLYWNSGKTVDMLLQTGHPF